MLRKIGLLIFLSIVLISTIACSINMPFTTDIKTGPTKVENISVAPVDPDETTDVLFAFGAGTFTLSSGSEFDLVEGSVEYNVDDFKPSIDINQNSVDIKQGNLELNGIPNFTEKVINDWDIKLGSDPINLTIKAGAYVGEFDLGGLKLENVRISDGASDVNLNFSTENLIPMNTFRYETGASDVEMKSLGYANFSTMILDSGAGNYDIDFSGGIEEDTNIFVESGLSNLTIRVPDGIPAVLKIEGALTNVSASGDWHGSGDTYTHDGDGPTLHFTIEMGAGNLILRSE